MKSNYNLSVPQDNEVMIRKVVGQETVLGELLELVSRAKGTVDFCIDRTKPSVAIVMESLIQSFVNAKCRGIKVRCVTELTTDNLNYCKKLREIAEVKHIENIKGDFYLSDTEYLASFSSPSYSLEANKGKISIKAIYSNTKSIVEQQKYLFDILWDKAIPAEQRIKEMEEGVQAEFFEIVNDRNKIGQILVDLAKSALNEILLLLPNDKSLVRINKLPVIDYLIKASRGGVTVKIICPLSQENEEIQKKIYDNAPDIKILNGNSTQHGLYIADGTTYLRVELVKPEAESFLEAIGFAVYSNHRSSTDLFRWMFELIWKQGELHEQLRIQNKLQSDFINVAAHQLRTPVTPILIMASILRSELEKKNNAVTVGSDGHEYIKIRKRDFSIIVSSANKLKRLTDDVLDVAKMESKTLKFEKQQFNLNDLIYIIVNEQQNQLKKEDEWKKDVKLHYKSMTDRDVFVEADKGRISQVVLNLLSNAIKFSEHGGDIYIIVETNGTKVMVSVIDEGQGIDQEMMPRLFNKFASKSLYGTGLGLFISRHIIEAHGGRIWANNNPEPQRGTTFSFTLPISTDKKVESKLNI